MDKLFVTGITGLLGTNLTINLLNKGYKVFGLLRKQSKYLGPKHKNLTLIRGTLFDDFTTLFKEMDCVIHIAAITQQNLINFSDYKQINYTATIQLLHTAIKEKVKRFVFVSTANTMGFGSLSAPGCENTPINYPFSNSLYAKSKKETELELLKHTHKIDLIIINPTFMIGGYDSKPSSGKLILMCWKKKFVFFPPGGKNFVHVNDVCTGIINSLSMGKTGEKYLLANENLSYLDFFRKVNLITNQKPKMIKIPLCILRLIGYIGDVLRYVHIKTNLCSSNMTALSINNYYSNRKSITELQANYQPIDNAIHIAVEYFKGEKK